MFGTFIVAVGLMTHVTTKLPLSVTYPTFAGVGTAGAVLGAFIVFGERLGPQQMAGIAIIIAGVVILHGPPLFSKS
jgi:small multidrug resistance pump